MQSMQGIYLKGWERWGRGQAVFWLRILLLAVSITARADEGSGGSDNEGAKRPSFFSRLDLSGYLKSEIAYRIREPRSLTKLREIVSVNAQYPYSSHIKFNMSAWAYYDLVYDLFDYDTVAARLQRNANEPLAFIVNLGREKDSPVAAVREAYADLFFGDVDTRIGKQFIVWGVLEGVRITDEINPMDFRELILPDLLDYRIPQWSTKVDIYHDKVSYELVWIPDLQFHKPAPPGSEWELLQEVPNTVYPKSSDLGNSEIGVKASTSRWDTEFSFSYLYTWDPFPVIFRRVRINEPIDPIFYPTYTRISMFGTTFSKQVKSMIVKGEAAYVTDKYFAIANEDANNDGYLDGFGEAKRNHIRWGLGVDYNVLGFDVSPSLTQWIILDYDRHIMQDKYDTGLNLFLRREFPQSSVVFQLLGIYLVNLREIYLKPKLTVLVTDKFQYAIGLDLFNGRSSQLGVASSASALGNFVDQEQRGQFFGNFHDNDRVFIDLKYAF